MNELNIAGILAGKRHEKGVTQEELAAYLGVSNGAVSKWEKRLSYPDITLLPRLAAYFNISVDELLGYTPQLTREEIRKLCRSLSADFTNKPFDEVMAEYREIIKEYYSCFPLLYNIAALLVNHTVSAGAEEKQKELLTEAKELCKRVASETDDALLAKDATGLHCLCCIWSEETDDVFAVLGESLPASALSEDILIAQAHELTGNMTKAKEVSQCGVYQHLMCLAASLAAYIGMSLDSFNTAQTALNRLMKLIRLFEIEKLDVNTTAKAYLIGIELYCKHGRRETALEWAEEYTNRCLTTFFPLKIQGDSFFTDIDGWLEEGELGSTPPLDERMIKQNMLRSLTGLPSVDALQDEPRYKAIVKKLTDFIGGDS